MPKQRILPHIILGIIATSEAEVTGKQITDYVQREIGEYWQVAHSQVYPELKRMTEDGWIVCHPVPNNEKEKQYGITELGLEMLENWLSEPNNELPLQKDIFTLKLFFIKDKDDQRIPKLIHAQIDLLNKHLEHLEQRKNNLFASPEDMLNRYGHYLILTRAIARNRDQIKWLKQTLKMK
ncbi:TPA: PadR family transcriptional regulator [Streptococcus suis]|nr:PadR family transcriptional regulator [Streptococcus suis]